MLHAVVALGAVHEFMETQGFLNPGKAVENAEDYAERHFALQQSTKAIECLKHATVHRDSSIRGDRVDVLHLVHLRGSNRT